MSVVWKPLKYKHRLEAQEISAGIKDKTISEVEMIEFVVDLVHSWDFIDVETGGPVAVGDYGELTEDQFVELMTAFQQKMEAQRVEAVKKNQILMSGSNSSFGSNGSGTAAPEKPRTTRRSRRTG